MMHVHSKSVFAILEKKTTSSDYARWCAGDLYYVPTSTSSTPSHRICSAEEVLDKSHLQINNWSMVLSGPLTERGNHPACRESFRLGAWAVEGFGALPVLYDSV